MTQHTPTPDSLNVGTKIQIVFQTSGAKRFVFPVEKGIEDNFEALAFAFKEEHAAFIVRACNSHDALVEALENLLDANPSFRSMPLGAPGSLARIAQEMAIEAEDAAKAAIALAKVSQ